MEGGSLFSALSYLKQAGFRALPPQDCLRLSRQVTNGLAYLHASAFSFGDLKTLNILLSATPNLHTGRFPTNVRAKLCDFGLSRNLKHLVDPCDVASNPNATQIPAQHGPAGTFAYLAPEAFAGLPTDDPDAPKRADIYALGIVLWELATLQTPWPGLRALQLIRLVGREGRRPEWPENVSHLSQGYIDLVERCWHQDPALRPSAEQVASELEAMYCAFGDTSESGLDLCTHMEDGESSDMLPRARNDSLLGTEAGLSVDSDSDVVRVDDD
ncbi:unnamed protein product [Chondrus crispus]|uniref:Protein kinase domain-containing protein n=1 Tax=Chondrus crispus TaxID=2769 RepID=R7Q2U2_CHOCR|nr:unnamed protein product [Chondrus crispus]CDF32887.1 unnamed protein product [Chondrus crispus]|eukprot:XP_005712688.1 unnamed protein product [Chondrus crispus]